MTTSNSTDFTVTRDDVLNEAFELIGVKDGGSSVSADDFASAIRSLNMFVKSEQAKGMFLWTNREATLFLALNTAKYRLGPTGTHATESYVETTLAADAAQGATTLSLTSVAGIAAADNIGIVLNDGSLFWSTVNNPATTTINNALTAAASSGNKVYAYTTKIDRPLEVINARRLTVSNTESPIEVVAQNEYDAMPNKTASGAVVQAAYDPQITNGVLSTWPRSSTVSDKIVFRAKFPIQDFDGDEDNPHFPVEWFDYLSLTLAYRIGAKFGLTKDRLQTFKAMAEEARPADAEDASITFAPRWR